MSAPAVGDLDSEELAALVCAALQAVGITVTLTGGGCVAIWSNGKYVSHDLDFIEEGPVPRGQVVAVMRTLGFKPQGRHFAHPDTDFLVEFPTGPLTVGEERVERVSERIASTGKLRLLSPTDCVKDRLAAFFHWKDKQALEQALLVATDQKVDLADVKRWSKGEGSIAEFEVFRARLAERVRKSKEKKR